MSTTTTTTTTTATTTTTTTVENPIIYKNLYHQSSVLIRAKIQPFRDMLGKKPGLGKLFWLKGFDSEKEEALESIRNWLLLKSGKRRMGIQKKNTYISKIDYRETQHPARGQHGMFASSGFQPLEIIAEFIGEYALIPQDKNQEVTFDREDISYAHGFWEDHYSADDPFDGVMLYPLAINPFPENVGAHLINDFKGIAEKNNAAPVEIWDAEYQNLPRIFIICKKEIKMDEEILLDYGDDYWKALNESRVEYANTRRRPVRKEASEIIRIGAEMFDDDDVNDNDCAFIKQHSVNDNDTEIKEDPIPMNQSFHKLHLSALTYM